MDIFLNTVSGKLTPAPAKKSPAEETPAKPATTSSAGAPAGGEAASLKLNDLKAGVAAAPVVDQERVAKIAGAIQSGNYEINPRRAAEKIIALENLLP